MVLPANPVRLLVKLPVPVPSFVEPMLLLKSGEEEISQTMPRAVIVVPPASVMSPPLVAELVVIFETELVVKAGTAPVVENTISSP